MRNSGAPSNINSILEKDTQFKIEESNNEIDDFDSIVGPSKFHKTSQESRNIYGNNSKMPKAVSRPVKARKLFSNSP